MAAVTYKEGKSNTDRCNECCLVLFSSEEEDSKHEPDSSALPSSSSCRPVTLTYNEVKNISMNNPWAMDVPPANEVVTFLDMD